MRPSPVPASCSARRPRLRRHRRGRGRRGDRARGHDAVGTQRRPGHPRPRSPWRPRSPPRVDSSWSRPIGSWRSTPSRPACDDDTRATSRIGWHRCRVCRASARSPSCRSTRWRTWRCRCAGCWGNGARGARDHGRRGRRPGQPRQPLRHRHAAAGSDLAARARLVRRRRSRRAARRLDGTADRRRRRAAAYRRAALAELEALHAARLHPETATRRCGRSRRWSNGPRSPPSRARTSHRSAAPTGSAFSIAPGGPTRSPRGAGACRGGGLRSGGGRAHGRRAGGGAVPGGAAVDGDARRAAGVRAVIGRRNPGVASSGALGNKATRRLPADVDGSYREEDRAPRPEVARLARAHRRRGVRHVVPRRSWRAPSSRARP